MKDQNKINNIITNNHKMVSAPYYHVPDKCHNATSYVFTWAGKKIYAGGQMRGIKIENNSLFLNLSNDKNHNLLYSTSLLLQDLCNKHNNIHTLNIDWPDFGVPELNRDFWEDIISVIETLPEEIDKVYVACAGGHGRTGTALSILWGLTEGKNHPEPVEFIREKYCKKVVESLEQIKYIECIIGRKITSKPRRYQGFNGGFGGGYYHSSYLLDSYKNNTTIKKEEKEKNEEKDEVEKIIKEQFFGHNSTVENDGTNDFIRNGNRRTGGGYLLDDDYSMYEGY